MAQREHLYATFDKLREIYKGKLIDYEKIPLQLPEARRTTEEIAKVVEFVDNLGLFFNPNHSNILYATVQVRVNPAIPMTENPDLQPSTKPVEATYVNFVPAIIYPDGTDTFFVHVPGLKHTVITQGHLYDRSKSIFVEERTKM